MTIRTVTTQAELDAALASEVDEIEVKSPAGVWLEISDHAGKFVSAFDSASVSASDSASVSAFDSASVRAFDSASVRAFDSASVSAFGSASVSAFDSASVSAGKWVAVHLHSQRVKLDGGVLIDMTAVDRSDAPTWCELNGVDVIDGFATVYKAVDTRLVSNHGTAYPVGATVTAHDWKAVNECGHGLHFGPTPAHAAEYHSGDGPRFLECRIPLADAVGLSDGFGPAKIKAKTCVVVREVDVHGRTLAVSV